MINLRPVVIASAALLMLNACSSSSSSGDPISVAAVSGVDADLTGTYATGCHGDGGGSVTEDLVISGNTWNYTLSEYTSADCSGTPLEGAIAGTVAIDGANIAITGWIDGIGDIANTVAFAADGGLMPADQTVTPLRMTVASTSGFFVGDIPDGFEAPLFYVVDDTGTNNMLYRDDDYEAGSTLAGYFDPFTKQ